MEPHDTIRRSFVGTTDRSVVNGIKIPSSCVATAGQFDTICLASTVSLQDKSDMIETWGAAAVGGRPPNDASPNPDDTYPVYNGVTKSIQQCRSDGFKQPEHVKCMFI